MTGVVFLYKNYNCEYIMGYGKPPPDGQCRQLKEKSTHCHSELVEESPSSTTRFVRKIILSYNLIVSIYALLLSFQIPRSLRFLGMTGVG